MSLPTTVHVVIVGAGPAGLACALVLASNNVPFLLLDALAEGQNESRAAVVHAHTLEQLEVVGAADALVRRGIHMGEFAPVDDAEHPIVHMNLFRALAPHTKYPYALLIAQCDVEAILMQRLKELGGTIHRQKRVARMDDADGALVVVLESGESVKAAYVVAADGSKSVIRSSAGIGLLNPHTGKPSVASDDDLQIVLADTLLAEPLPPAVPRDRLWATFDAHGFLMLIPLRSDIIEQRPDAVLYRFAATVPQGTAPHTPDVDYVQRLLDARGPGRAHPGAHGAQVAAIASGSRYRVRSGLSETFAKQMPRSGGWVLLAGDAAHIHSPAGGQGMNLGLCDGMRLANALVSVERGEPAEAAFRRYGDVRRAAARAVIGMVEGLTALNGHWLADNWMVKTMRNFVLRIVLVVPGVESAVAWRLSGLVHRE